jgi:hypothetical protein
MNLKKLAAIAASVAFMIAPVTAAHADTLPAAPSIQAAATDPQGVPGIDVTVTDTTAFVDGVTEFDFFVSTNKGKTWQVSDVRDSQMADADTTTQSEQIGWYGKYLPLKPLASYSVKVVAVNAAGKSIDSNIFAVKLPAYAPLWAMGSVGADQKQKFSKGILVKWQAQTGGKAITSFSVKYRAHSADGTGAWTTYKKTAANVSSLSIPYAKVKGLKDIDIAVAATNSVGTRQGECEIKVDAKGNISVWV